jgi:hypothetical protein
MTKKNIEVKNHPVETRVRVNSEGHKRHGHVGTVVGHDGDDHRVKFDGSPEDIDLFAAQVLEALMTGDEAKLNELEAGAKAADKAAA